MPGRKLAATVVVGLLASLTVSACMAPRRSDDSERTESAALTEIVLSGDVGKLTVEPGSGPGTVIKRHARYQRHDKPAPGDRTDGSVLRLETRCGRDCAIDYVVAVPTRVKISGRGGAGAIDLRTVGAVALDVEEGSITVKDADGPVSVTTWHGSIEVFDAKGNVTARTGTGRIRIHRSGGSVTARTFSGQVEVRDAGGDKVTLRSSNGTIGVFLNRPQSVSATSDEGAIKVAVPAGAPFDVHATTKRGTTRIDVPVTSGAPNTLELDTERGEIAVVPL